MTKTTLVERLRYRFDNFMSKGTVALIGGLGLVCLAFILLMAMLISFTAIMPEGSDRSLLESIWNVLMHAIDTGNVAGDKGWRFRLAMLIVTFGGIFGVSTLIGIVSSGIDAKRILPIAAITTFRSSLKCWTRKTKPLLKLLDPTISCSASK